MAKYHTGPKLSQAEQDSILKKLGYHKRIHLDTSYDPNYKGLKFFQSYTEQLDDKDADVLRKRAFNRQRRLKQDHITKLSNAMQENNVNRLLPNNVIVLAWSRDEEGDLDFCVCNSHHTLEAIKKSKRGLRLTVQHYEFEDGSYWDPGRIYATVDAGSKRTQQDVNRARDVYEHFEGVSNRLVDKLTQCTPYLLANFSDSRAKEYSSNNDLKVERAILYEQEYKEFLPYYKRTEENDRSCQARPFPENTPGDYTTHERIIRATFLAPFQYLLADTCEAARVEMDLDRPILAALIGTNYENGNTLAHEILGDISNNMQKVAAEHTPLKGFDECMRIQWSTSSKPKQQIGALLRSISAYAKNGTLDTGASLFNDFNIENFKRNAW